MKVCAHMNTGPFSNEHSVFDSIGDAISEFRDILDAKYGNLSDILERTGEEYAPALDVYPACGDCNSQMNFHDHPMSRYQVGPRGGIRKVYV